MVATARGLRISSSREHDLRRDDTKQPHTERPAKHMCPHLHSVNDDETATDPIAPLKDLGVRVCWVSNLGDPAAYVPEYRVMLLDAALTRVEVCAYVRRWVMNRLPA